MNDLASAMCQPLTHELAAEAPWVREPIPDGRCFFVLGAGRSGTTSAIRILGRADNVEAFAEPRPRLRGETRLHALGKLLDPRPLIWASRVERIRAVLGSGRIYGEKDQQMFPWIRFFDELFHGRFLFVQRDGRDAVRSMLDFHYRVNGMLYREAGGDEDLPAEVRARLDDLWSRPASRVAELARPRPLPGDRWYERWLELTRLQMAAWLWTHYNGTALAQLFRLAPERWQRINYSAGVSAACFERLYELTGLEGFDAVAIDRMLAARINTITENFVVDLPRFPGWRDWSEAELEQFDRIAADMMVQLGYYSIDRLRFEAQEEELARYELEPLTTCTTPDLGTLMTAEAVLGEARSALVIAAEGAELTMPPRTAVTRWTGGRLGDLPRGPYDLVVAIGAIDRVPEMDRLLIELAQRASSALVIVPGRGSFPTHHEHHYRRAGGAWANEWSASRAASLLTTHLGMGAVSLRSLATEHPARPELDCLLALR